MGKLILCSGERTKRPYGFTSTGIRIYSIEELCYYLYHHVYMIDEDMFSDDLLDWIEMELKLTERARMLKNLKKQKSDLKTMVTVVLCSADYYTEHEIKVMLKLLDDMIGMPSIKRSCIKANNYLQDGKYMDAAVEYERIINSMEATELSPEEYGDIYHNMAVAKVHTVGLKQASHLFYEAYERNHREDSLRQYLYSLKLCNNDSGYLEKLEEYQVSDELIESITQFLEGIEREAKYSVQQNEIEYLKKKKAQGKMKEYYKKTDDMIDTWKAKIRQM